MKKLTRSNTDRKICGVCGGIAEYLNVDSTIIRVLFVFAVGFNIILYLILAFIIPEADY